MDQTIQNKMQAPSSHMMTYGIPFLRIAFGLWFLYHEAYEKIHAWTPETMPKLFKMWGENPQGYGFYKSFLLYSALANTAFFTKTATSCEVMQEVKLVSGPAISIIAPVQISANRNQTRGKTHTSTGPNSGR